VARRRRGPPTPDSQPLGVGVADAYAIERLAPGRKRAPKKAVRELGWAAFGEVSRALSAAIARRFSPSVVIGIAKGGVFAGSAIATALGAEFFPLRVEKRRRDTGLAEVRTTLPDLTGRAVLVVDDVARTGATLAKARALAKKAGAREIRTAVLVTRPDGARPDFAAIETDELVLFGWDYELHGGQGGPEDPGDVGV
jgi:hypoxanthine phosphoribosyltransferase